MTYHSLTPAYARDYKSKAEVKAALLADQDFILNRMGGTTYANLTSFEAEPGSTLNVRYDRIRKVAVFKVAALLKERTNAQA
jgi:hypothetical protein